MKRIRVPEEMIEAAMGNGFYPGRFSSPGDKNMVRRIVEAALLWASEHPQVPTDEQIAKLDADFYATGEQKGSIFYAPKKMAEFCAVEWQRRCFVQEEPEIPSEIEDLLWDLKNTGWRETEKKHNKEIHEAYRRGLRKGEQK